MWASRRSDLLGSRSRRTPATKWSSSSACSPSAAKTVSSSSPRHCTWRRSMLTFEQQGMHPIPSAGVACAREIDDARSCCPNNLWLQVGGLDDLRMDGPWLLLVAGLAELRWRSVAKQSGFADLHADGTEIRASRNVERGLPCAIGPEIDALEIVPVAGYCQPHADDRPFPSTIVRPRSTRRS